MNRKKLVEVKELVLTHYEKWGNGCSGYGITEAMRTVYGDHWQTTAEYSALLHYAGGLVCLLNKGPMELELRVLDTVIENA